MSNLFTFSGGPPIQDYVILGGKKSPGVCSIVNAGTPRKWDVRDGYALSGAYLIYTGDSLPKFDVIVTLWDPPQRFPGQSNQWTDWADFATVLAKAPKGTRPKFLSIIHPVLVFPPLNITQVAIDDVLQPMQNQDGLWDITIRLIEARAPLPVIGRPNQAIPPVKNPQPTAQDKADIEIQALTKQFLELAGK